jgi:hypothetical protein
MSDIVCGLMGTGDVELTAEALRQLFALDPTAKRLSLSDMGDGVYFCRVAPRPCFRQAITALSMRSSRTTA